MQRERSNSEIGSSRSSKLRRLFRGGISKVVKERAIELDEATRLGAYYVTDAFAGRLEHGMAKMSQQPPLIFAAFRLQTSETWLAFVLACNFVHTLLVFVEEPNGAAFAQARGWLPPLPGPCRLLELALILVYVTDVALKASYMGWTEYFSKPWQKLFAVVIGILLLDAATLSPLRLTRPLRPAVLCLRARSVRRFFTVVRNMVPGFLRVCLPLVFFLLLSSSFGAMAFGRADGALSSPGKAGYNLWILTVCAENYEDLLPRTKAGGIGGDARAGGGATPLYYAFFFVTLAVGHIFLLGLLLGITFDVFIAHTKAQVKSERLKELKGLTKAFAVMDTAGSGKLGSVAWDKFLQHLMPHLSRQERVLYFEIGSGFADEIDVIAFLDLRQVLDYRFVSSDQLRAARHSGASGGFRARLASVAGKLKASSWFRPALAAAVTLDCVLLPWGAPGAIDGYSAGASPGSWQPPAVLALEVICSAMLFSEVLCSLAVAGTRPAAWRWFMRLSDHERVAAAAVLMHAAANAVLHGPLLPLFCKIWAGCCGSNGDGSGDVPAISACRGAMAKIVYTLRLLRCWRLVTLNATLHQYVSTFFHILPAFLQTLSFALIIAYFFAVSAMDAFGGSVSRFKSPGAALLTMIQLFFGVDFKGVVEDTMNGAGDARGAALAFFMVYHVLGVLIVFNLINAIIIQFYSETLNERSMQREEEQRGVDEKLQEALLEHVRKQRVVALWGKKNTQGVVNVSLVRRRPNVTGRELRRVLGVGSQGESLSEDDLQKCQKYARRGVDLLAALKERREGEKSLLDFERAFYQQVKASPPAPSRCFVGGDVIFEAGLPHGCCYFVQRGKVLLTDRDGNRQMKEIGEMFGEVALLGEVPQPVTARAVSGVDDCECLVVSREDFEDRYNDVSTMGHLAIRIRRARSLDTGSFYGGSGAGNLAIESPLPNESGNAAAAAMLARETATAAAVAAVENSFDAPAAAAAAATAAAAEAAAGYIPAAPTAVPAAAAGTAAITAGPLTAFAMDAPPGQEHHRGGGDGGSDSRHGGAGSSGTSGSTAGCIRLFGSGMSNGAGSSSGGVGRDGGRSCRTSAASGGGRSRSNGKAEGPETFAGPAASPGNPGCNGSSFHNGSNGLNDSNGGNSSTGSKSDNGSNGSGAAVGIEVVTVSAARLGNTGKRPASAMSNAQDGRFLAPLGAVSSVAAAPFPATSAGPCVAAGAADAATSGKADCYGSPAANGSNGSAAGSNMGASAAASSSIGAAADGSNGAAANGSGSHLDSASLVKGSSERHAECFRNGHGNGDLSESDFGSVTSAADAAPGVATAATAATTAVVLPLAEVGGWDPGDGRRRSKRRAPGPAEGDACVPRPAPALARGTGGGSGGAGTDGGRGRSKKRRL